MSSPDLEKLFELRNLVDELIEEGMVKRWSVSEVLGTLMPRVAEHLPIQGLFFETYGEDLELHLFPWAEGGQPLTVPAKVDVWAKTTDEARTRVVLETDRGLVVAQHLDVAGSWFGRAGVLAKPGADADWLAR